MPAGRVYTVADIARDPQYIAREMIVRGIASDGEAVAMPGIVPKMSATPGSVRERAPRLGEHTDVVLRRDRAVRQPDRAVTRERRRRMTPVARPLVDAGRILDPAGRQWPADRTKGMAMAWTARSVLRHRQPGDGRFGVVPEADAVHAVGGLELPGGDRRGLVVAADDGAVDRALDLVAFDRDGDLLRDRLSLAGCLVDRGVRPRRAGRSAGTLGTEAAHDEVAVAVRRAVQIALLVGADVVAARS